MNVLNKDLFSLLYDSAQLHSPYGSFHRYLSAMISGYIEQSRLTSELDGQIDFGPFGTLNFPYFSMGNIDSLKLFGLDELILFSFYWKNKGRYNNVADMGANIGLHSVLMSKLGWNVTSFEPDPVHIEQIINRAELNGVSSIVVKENAIANESTSLTFTRLTGNRTGSHLKGKKEHVYGEVEEFSVDCLAFNEIMNSFDFIKMDIEGAEADAICSTTSANWDTTEVMLEVGSEANAERIWQHIQKTRIHAFAQLNGWQEVTALSDMPKQYKDGSLFLSKDSHAPFSLQKLKG